MKRGVSSRVYRKAARFCYEIILAFTALINIVAVLFNLIKRRVKKVSEYENIEVSLVIILVYYSGCVFALRRLFEVVSFLLFPRHISIEVPYI